MCVSFVSDESGRITAVQVHIKVWTEFERKAEAFDVAESIKKV